MPPVQIKMNNLSNELVWYTIVTKFNYEQKFSQDLRRKIEVHGVENIKEIFVPTYEEKYIKKTRGGEKAATRSVNLYPGYVFVKCYMNEDIWSFIRKTSGCATILATGDTPCVIYDGEIHNMKKACAPRVKFEIGENIEINNGVFSGNRGIVESIDYITKVATIALYNNLNITVNTNDLIRA